MDKVANAIIDYLGGTTKVARLLEAPVSTVHAWRKYGIPRARLAHFRLAAKDVGKPLPENLDELVAEAA